MKAALSRSIAPPVGYAVKEARKTVRFSRNDACPARCIAKDGLP